MRRPALTSAACAGLIFSAMALGAIQSESKPPRVPGRDHIAPAPSPTGRWLLYTEAFRPPKNLSQTWRTVVARGDGTRANAFPGTEGTHDNVSGESTYGASLKWLPDDRLLVTNGGTTTTAAVLDPETGRRREILRAADAAIGPVAVSPKGDLVLYRRADAPERGLHVITIDRARHMRLTDGNDVDPQWSPDGKRVAFFRDRRPALADLDGEVRLLSVEPGRFPQLTWSPDGRSLILDTDIESATGEGNAPVHLISAADGAVRLFDRGSDNHAWSADSTRVASVKPFRIVVQDVKSGRTTRLPIELEWYETFSWHPRANWVIAATEDGVLAASADGKSRRLLAPFAAESASVGSDGTRVYLSARGDCGGEGIYSVRWPDGPPVRITNGCVITGTPRGDVLTGTRERDIIHGLAGNDVIDANPGGRPNVYTGREDNDTVDGGGGNDRILGRNGVDTITGGTGNDAIDGGTGGDHVAGGPGNDTLDGGRYLDRVSGGAGNDTIVARDGFRDRIACGPGYDSVSADAKDIVSADCERVMRSA